MPEAVIAANKSDIVIACLGLSPVLEGEEGDAPAVMQNDDRINLGLPGEQSRLLKAIAATGKPVVVVLCNGGPLSIPEEIPLADAVIEAWYPGEEGGAAIADIIFGNACPSGRMPVTVVKSIEDIPPFEDYNMAMRTYRYMTKEPLFPFGFGLSYTLFTYETHNMPDQMSVGSDLSFDAVIRNVGNFDGDAVLQIYLKHLKPSVEVPNYQLVHFERQNLMKDQEKSVHITIPSRLLAVIRPDGSCLLEPDEIQLFIGDIQPDRLSEKLAGYSVKSAEIKIVGKPITIQY